MAGIGESDDVEMADDTEAPEPGTITHADPSQGGSASASASVPPPRALWLRRTQEWYPDVHQQPYFVTPVHINRTHHSRDRLESGRDVAVLKGPVKERPRGHGGGVLSESDVRDDQTTRSILSCLRRVSRENNEVMFVFSQLLYDRYLEGDQSQGLPRPSDLKTQQLHQGDFDVLIIHRQHGILVGETKAVGDFKIPDEAKMDDVVKTQVRKAISQLKKATGVLQHITSDLGASSPQLLNTIMLPNISRGYLQRLLANEPKVLQDLCGCLNVDTNDDPTLLCLTSDDISSPQQWWERWKKHAGTDANMTNDVYVDLVSRFAGPATTVSLPCSSVSRLAQAQHKDVRTPGEGVAEAGNRMTPVEIVLHPRQVEVLNDRNMPLAFLTGPPGTGKSLVLVLKGQEWLRQDKHVHVVSTRKESRAASYMVHSQLLQCESDRFYLLHFHDFNMPMDRMKAINELAAEAVGPPGNEELYVIVDEAWDCYSSPDSFHQFCAELQRRVRHLHLWAASLYNKCRPPNLTEVRLTEALRTPPSITREVEKHRGFLGQYLFPYTGVSAPLPTEGLDIIDIHHTGGEHATERSPPECQECGREIARLLDRLDVGKPARGADCPTPPSYSDVFILTYGSYFHDEEKDASGHVTKPASGLIQGVRDSGCPVRVLDEDNDRAVLEVATMSGPDAVVAANSIIVNGLERKIVVFVQHASAPEYGAEDWGKLWAMSRCTAQLVWLRPPRVPQPKVQHPKPAVICRDLSGQDSKEEESRNQQPTSSVSSQGVQDSSMDEETRAQHTRSGGSSEDVQHSSQREESGAQHTVPGVESKGSQHSSVGEETRGQRQISDVCSEGVQRRSKREEARAKHTQSGVSSKEVQQSSKRKETRARHIQSRVDSDASEDQSRSVGEEVKAQHTQSGAYSDRGQQSLEEEKGGVEKMEH